MTGEEIADRLGVVKAAILAQRARFGRARVLIDLLKAPIQSQETAARINAGTAKIYRAGDKVALLCTGGLLKLQAKRTTSFAETQIFSSIDEAKNWLLAD